VRQHIYFCEQLHEAIRKRSAWNEQLKQFSWRIDVTAKSRNEQAAANQTTAIVEMKIAKDKVRNRVFFFFFLFFCVFSVR
jgi:hypothetical protein